MRIPFSHIFKNQHHHAYVAVFVVAVLVALSVFRPFAVPEAQAAASFDAAANSPDLSNLTSGSWSHTITVSGSDRYVVVGLSGWDATDSLTGVTVTFNGLSMTTLGGAQTAGENNAVLWGRALGNLAAGAYTVAVSNIPEAYTELGGGSVSFIGVDQASPTGTLVSEFAGDGSVDITMATGDIGVDIVYCGACATAPPVPGAGETPRVNTNIAGGLKWIMMGTEGGLGTVTMNWTTGEGSDWANAAVPIKGISNFPPTVPALAETPAFANWYTNDQTPLLGTFSSTDNESNPIEYRIQWDNDADFSSVIGDQNSVNHATNGFSAATFGSGAVVSYQIEPPDVALANGTYWWRVQARDPAPAGSDSWSGWSPIRSFTMQTLLTSDSWLQTTSDQFLTTPNASVDIDPVPGGGSVKLKGW